MTEPEFTTKELQNEEWRDVVGYENLYSISNLGRVRRDKANRVVPSGYILKQRVIKRGYRDIKLRNFSGIQKTHLVHQLVAAAFLGACPKGFEINHIKNPKSNNRLTNLEYLTHADNMIHAANSGVMKSGLLFHPEKIVRGEACKTAKLTEVKVLEIIELIKAKTEYLLIAQMYNISVYTVQRIKLKKTWKHVTCQSPL